MQVYKNNGRLHIIYGSRAHHFNERRLAKVSQKYMLSLQSMHDTDKIDQFMKKHRIKTQDYSGGYMDLVSKHRLQVEFSKGIDDQKNQKKSDAVADDLKHAVPESGWIDDLLDIIKDLIRNPEVKTVDDFINLLFIANTAVMTHDKDGKALKFWRFQHLNSKHPFEVSAKWFSQMYEQHPAWTGTNLAYCLKNDSLGKIHEDSSWIPRVGNYPILFILWGDYGANQEKAQKYLADQYQIKPLSYTGLSYFDQQIQHSASMIVYNAKDVKNLIKSNSKMHVLPVKMVMPNQRTAFKRLLRRNTPYRKAKKLIKDNFVQDNRDAQGAFAYAGGNVVKHSAVIYGNLVKRMYQGLDWLMTNYSENLDTSDDLYKFSAVSKILTKY